MTDPDILAIATAAVQRYAEMHPRPCHVTQTQAAAMLKLSRPTISRLIKYGSIKLNDCGMIPIDEIDRVIRVRKQLTPRAQPL